MNIQYAKQTIKTINNLDKPTKQRIKQGIENDVAILEDLVDIKKANEEFARGEYVCHEDIN